MNNRTHLQLVLLAVLLTAQTGCATLPGLESVLVQVDKGDPFPVVFTDEIDLNRQNWGIATHIYLVPVSTSRLAVTYYLAGDGTTRGRAPLEWPMFSDDLGQTWQHGNPYAWTREPASRMPTVIERGRAFQNFDLGTFFGYAVFPDGERVVFTRRLQHPRYASYVIRSLDDGLTWQPPELYDVEFPAQMDVPDNILLTRPGVVMPDGRLLIAAHGRLKSERRESFLLESTDRGRSFQFVSVIASMDNVPSPHNVTHTGPMEPALALLPNGDLLCVMRTHIGGVLLNRRDDRNSILQARSTDGGLTWTDHRILTTRHVMPRLLQMSNGVLVMGVGRPGNKLLFSLDNGRTWGAEIYITPPTTKTSGYFDFIEVEPGRLLVVYDLIDTSARSRWGVEAGDDRINAVMGVFVDVTSRL